MQMIVVIAIEITSLPLITILWVTHALALPLLRLTLTLFSLLLLFQFFGHQLTGNTFFGQRQIFFNIAGLEAQTGFTQGFAPFDFWETRTQFGVDRQVGSFVGQLFGKLMQTLHVIEHLMHQFMQNQRLNTIFSAFRFTAVVLQFSEKIITHKNMNTISKGGFAYIF